MNLAAKRILITRPRAQAEEFAATLMAEGAQPIFFPVIEIIPLDDFSSLDKALHHLDQYDWLILTSVHSVDIFFKRLKFLNIRQIPRHLQVAVIGSKTASHLSEHGVKPNFIPEEYTVEAILSGLKKNISGKRFLLPQSDLARETLAKELRSCGGVVDEIIAYHTKTIHPDLSAMDALRSGVDVITFASPSSVKGFLDILNKYNFKLRDLPGNPLVACIGPVTASAAREAGFIVDIEAKEHTIAGLITALKKI